jgi:L-seryl-tRNA(Ser) seleniumtransferase
VRKHPLLRALRVDKLTYAALEGTLVEHLAGRADESLPVLRMAKLRAEAIGARADRVASPLRTAGWLADVVDGVSTIGGGSAPGSVLPTRLIAIAHGGQSADTLDARCRGLDTPIIGRIDNDRFLLDLRTVREEEDEEIVVAFRGM